MSAECASVHKIFSDLKRHNFPYDENQVPLNGIYILFEKEEKGHQKDRVVRVGTHTGKNQLRSRLKQHYLAKNKDRSIFRKNVGRAILNQRKDPYLELWELDLTSKSARNAYLHTIDLEYQSKIEIEISQYISDSFSFAVFEIHNKEDRLEFESKIISTISSCHECRPSNTWLGSFSPKKKIVDSGLWLVNELNKMPFDSNGVESFSKLIKIAD